MKTVRLIKRHEMQTAAPREEQPAIQPPPRPAVQHWAKERQRTTPTTARRAFAALFTAPAEQLSY